MQKILLCVLSTVMLTSCMITSGGQTLETINQPLIQASLATFRANARAATRGLTIEELFGKPDRDIGSGIHIYQYDLQDKTQVWVGYDGERILYVRHMDNQGNMLEKLCADCE